MTTTSQSTLTLVTRTVPIVGGIFGLREIDSFGSILRVRAAPFADLNRLRSTAGNLAHVTYVIDAPRIYTGHGKGSRQIGDRLDPQELKQAQVYVIYSLDPRFDKLTASYVEDRLVDVANKLGVPLANRTQPLGRGGLHICPNLEQLVDHADFLLAVAGFRRFEDARQTAPDRPARLPATADLHGVFIIEPEDVSIPADAVKMRLVHDTLKAEGYEIGDDRFVVLPGADYCREMKSGLSDDNRARREDIETLSKQLDLLEDLPGVAHHRRLRVGLDCKSAPIAAKIITGEHLGNSAWTAAPLPAPGEAGAA
jgi:hypothetical protein